MSLTDLITFLKEYGLQSSGLIIISILLWSFLKTDWISKKVIDLFNKLLSKKPDNKINMSHIINHNMFNYIDFWIYSKVPTIKFSTEYRTVIFRKYLTVLLMKYRDNMQKYITSSVYEEMDESELWKSILTLFQHFL